MSGRQFRYNSQLQPQFSDTYSSIRVTLLLLFAVSGFAGLIYESVWSHYLKLLLGHAAYAQTLVLAIFMGGMTLGAYYTSRKSSSLRNPLKLYAIAELIVGVAALLFHNIFLHTLDLFHQTLIPSLSSPAQISLAKWLLSAALILPQSFLLGATFPLMSAAIIRLDRHKSGSTVSMLYFTNSFGASLGVLFSGFFLVTAVGLPGTSLTAGLLNIVLAIVVWPIAKRCEDVPALDQQELEDQNRIDAASARGGSAPSPSAGTTTAIILITSLLTGLASFFYQIGWIRMLVQVLGSTTQAFELMLSAFIMGLAFGGLWIHKRIDQINNTMSFVGVVQVIMGLLALCTLPLYLASFDWMADLIKGLSKNSNGYSLFLLSSHTIPLIIMLPTTFMAGMTLPLLTNSLVRNQQGESSIGKVYAANTVGAILGVMLATHYVMPEVGMKGLIFAGACIDVALGLFILVVFRGAASSTATSGTSPGFGSNVGLRPSVLIGFSMLSIALLVAIPMLTHFDPMRLSSGVYRHGMVSTAENTKCQVLFYKDGKTASISVKESANGTTIISTNGKPDASITSREQAPSGDENTMVLAASLPLAIHPTATLVGNIGMGSGITTHTLLAMSSLERIDTIEIEKEMIEGARLFGDFSNRAFEDERSHIHIDDAKSYFSSNKSKYDIIISEPSNPWVSGVASLFSDEFYHYIKQHLECRRIIGSMVATL